MENNEVREEYFEAEVNLDNLLKQELQGAVTRSKIKWMEEGERSTEYFFRLEKSLLE